MSFSFVGDLEISKSWMNRALILQAQQNDIEILGQSTASDVVLLKQALKDFQSGKTEFYVGLGGTTFRFLSLFLSRFSGQYKITAEKKLFDRPQNELIDLLNQLGIQSQFNREKEFFEIISQGWNHPKVIKIKAQDSSQFVSGLVLSAIKLPHDLHIEIAPQMISQDYFKYTVAVMQQAGCAIRYDEQKGIVDIPQQMTLTQKKLTGEVDVSSFFALAVAAVLSGNVKLTNWNKNSLQPDMQFISIFKEMGLVFESENNFVIAQQSLQKNIVADLGNCPDLFPVLAVLSAFAPGNSKLFGAKQLVHKESNRIEKTYELLTKCGFQCHKRDDGLEIKGNPQAIYRARDIILFDPDHDHRMAFAAAILILKGFPIQMTEPQVIQKSYQDFYKHIGLSELDEMVTKTNL